MAYLWYILIHRGSQHDGVPGFISQHVPQRPASPCVLVIWGKGTCQHPKMQVSPIHATDPGEESEFVSVCHRNPWRFLPLNPSRSVKAERWNLLTCFSFVMRPVPAATVNGFSHGVPYS